MSARRQCEHELRVGYRCRVCRSKWDREWHRKRALAHALSGSESARHRRGQVARLNDWYVRRLLSIGTDVPDNAWPASLVAIKRLHLEMRRQEWAS